MCSGPSRVFLVGQKFGEPFLDEPICSSLSSELIPEIEKRLYVQLAKTLVFLKRQHDGNILVPCGNHELSFIPEILWQVRKLWRRRPSDLGFRHSAQSFQVRTATSRARRLTCSLLRSVFVHGDYSCALK